MRLLKYLLCIYLLASTFHLLSSKVNAAIGLEQYISITNQEYSATESAKPEDNSLGLIYWDQDAYNDETVYFEAILRCDSCSGGNNQALATLYTDGGNPVSGASVTTSESEYTLVRTNSAITSNLIDNTAYTVRLSRDATAGTAYLIAARLVIIQSSESKLTHTQTQIEIGSAGSTTNTNYALISNPKIFYFDSTNYAPAPTAYFEATLKISASDQTATAALSTSSTCASTVDGASVSVTNGTNWAHGRSNSISISTGTYYVCLKSSDLSATASLANAKLVLSQENSGGIAKTSLAIPLHTTPRSNNTDAYTALGATALFTPANFTGAKFNYYYQSILQNTGGTGYSRLYNTSDSSIISNSEISTNSTAFTLLTSPEITSHLPTSTKNIDTQLRNSSTDTTTASSSWIKVNMIAYPSLSFSIAGVASNTLTNGITTSATSTADKLDFGSLTVSSPKYLAHQLNATTNTASGYTVSVKMNSTLQGMYPANIIEEFPSTWSSPQAWTEPTGTTANVNTGWFGANTSDTRVSGWENASGLFGPIGTTSHTVMRSPGIDGGSSVYVTYAIEVNRHQPTDTYAARLEYSILPIY